MLKILLYVTFVFCLEDTHAVYSYVVPLCAAYVYVLYLLYLYNIYNSYYLLQDAFALYKLLSGGRFQFST